MKKLMSILVSMLFALSLTGLCFAQETPNAGPPEKKTEQVAPVKAEKKVVKAKKKVVKAKKKKAKKAVKKTEKKVEEPAPPPGPEPVKKYSL